MDKDTSFLDSLLFGNYTVVLILSCKDKNNNESFKYKALRSSKVATLTPTAEEEGPEKSCNPARITQAILSGASLEASRRPPVLSLPRWTSPGLSLQSQTTNCASGFPSFPGAFDCSLENQTITRALTQIFVSTVKV